MTQMENLAGLGFTYRTEIIRGGRVIEEAVDHNLIPTEGLNAIVGYLLKGTAVPAAWYIGLFEGNYNPSAADTAAAFIAAATESTAYAEATRQAYTPGAVNGGAADNSLARAAFTCNVAAPGTKTIYGGFITPVSAKSATGGPLLSAVRFASPKVLGNGDILRVTAGLTFTSM